jgi:hypothetical protein
MFPADWTLRVTNTISHKLTGRLEPVGPNLLGRNWLIHGSWPGRLRSTWLCQ